MRWKRELDPYHLIISSARDWSCFKTLHHLEGWLWLKHQYSVRMFRSHYVLLWISEKNNMPRRRYGGEEPRRLPGGSGVSALDDAWMRQQKARSTTARWTAGDLFILKCFSTILLHPWGVIWRIRIELFYSSFVMEHGVIEASETSSTIMCLG